MAVDRSDSTSSKLLTPHQVADLCGFCYHTVLRAIQRNELRATRLKGRIRIPQWALDEWIEQNMIEPSENISTQLPEIRPRVPSGIGNLKRLREIELEGARTL